MPRHEDTPAEPVRQDEKANPEHAQALLEALGDPALAVRSAALRALVRLPLDHESWFQVGRFVWQELRRLEHDDLAAADQLSADEVLNAAVYVPILPVRELVRELAQGPASPLQRGAAHALAPARDDAALEPLLAELAAPEPEQRAAAAAGLSFLQAPRAMDALRRAYREDDDGDARFWAAVALARLDDPEPLRAMLTNPDTPQDVHLFWGDPQVAASALAARAPFPKATVAAWEAIAADESGDSYLRGVAEAVLERLGPEPPPLPSPSAEPMPAPRVPAAMRREAALLASKLAKSAHYQYRQLPDVAPLAYATPRDATRVVTALFSHAVERLPAGQRALAGNDIMGLPQGLWRSYTPDVPALVGLYLKAADDYALSQQLAWTLSRGGVGALLAELAPRLSAAGEAERVALLRLIEEAARYARLPYGPIFGGGEAAPDIAPVLDQFIELEEREAAARPDDGAPPPRWLQAQLYEAGAQGEQPAERALRAGAEHRMVVRIGEADERWITPPPEAAVPVADLPQDQEVWELTVTFWEPNHVPQPLTDTLWLPRRRGNSSTCEFRFRPRADAPRFEGHLVLRYGPNNRIIQTLFLTAEVLDDPATAPAEAAIALQPELAVRASLAGLADKKPFDAALVADQGSAGLQVAGFAAERVELRSLEGVEEPIARLRRRLTRIATSPDQFGSLEAEATQELLRFLARQGSLLYNGLVKSQAGGAAFLDDRSRRIQLVSARESFLPLEFIYDHPSPNAAATLCPQARQALETGQCSVCPTLDEAAARAVICPLGFWCMSRVIERHAVRPVAETRLSSGEYALQADPIAGREVLRVLASALYTASARVQAAQIAELLGTLSTVTNQQAAYVEDWDGWRQGVQAKAPSLLVLLPHTLKDADDIPTLEIGDKKQLPEDQITADYVHGGPGADPPVVLLLGCETAVPDIPFQGFAAQFRGNGAAIVLSTLAPVLGRHAIPVAAILASELARAAGEGGTFGDALLGLRRRALAAGIPMVLGLVAYGDADWRLAG